MEDTLLNYLKLFFLDKSLILSVKELLKEGNNRNVDKITLPK